MEDEEYDALLALADQLEEDENQSAPNVHGQSSRDAGHPDAGAVAEQPREATKHQMRQDFSDSIDEDDLAELLEMVDELEARQAAVVNEVKTGEVQKADSKAQSLKENDVVHERGNEIGRTGASIHDAEYDELHAMAEQSHADESQKASHRTPGLRRQDASQCENGLSSQHGVAEVDRMDEEEYDALVACAEHLEADNPIARKPCASAQRYVAQQNKQPLNACTDDATKLDEEEYDALLALADELEEREAQDVPKAAADRARAPAIKLDEEEYDALLALAAKLEEREAQDVPKAAAGGAQALPPQRVPGVLNLGARGQQSRPKPVAHAGYKEPLSGIQVSRPRMSSIILQESYSGFCQVVLSKVGLRGLSKAEGPWVTVGVIAQRNTSLGNSGKMYLRWQVADLDDTSLCVFLFGDAHRELNKEMEGTVVALYNAEIRQEGGKTSLTIKHPSQVTAVGTTTDFALCKGTKKNGERCTMPVNKSKCEYCIYHAPSALKSLSKTVRKDINVADTRMGMKLQRQVTYNSTQALAAVRANRALQHTRSYNSNDMKQIAQNVMAKRQDSKGARLLMSMAQQCSKQSGSRLGNTPAPAVQQCLKQSSNKPACRATAAGQERDGRGTRTTLETGRSRPAQPAVGDKRVREEFVELDDEEDFHLINTPRNWSQSEARLKAIQLIKQKGGLKPADPNDTRPCSKPKLSRDDGQVHGPSSAGVGHAMSADCDTSTRPASAGVLPSNTSTIHNPAVKAAINGQRPVGQGTRPLGNSSNRQNQSKGPADSKASTMQKALGMKKPAAVGCSGKPVPAAGNSGAAAGRPPRRPEGNKENQKPGHAAAAAANHQQPQPISAAVSSFAAAFGGLPSKALDSDERITSRYQQQVGDTEDEQIFKFVDSMERKDQLAQKLDATTKVQTTAWRCEACQRTTEMFPKECKAEGHSIKQVQAVKRWWTCVSCSAHFSCVGALYPNRRCPRCQDPNKEFKPATAFRTPKLDSYGVAEGSKLACKEHMMARGVEHGKFLRR